MEREKVIVKTSIYGIVTNIVLVIFKIIAGMISGSISIIIDALNNLSDVLSSLITIVGTKLANKYPDKKHPLGYGRIEYLSAMIISMIIIYAGVVAFFESVKNIIDKRVIHHSNVTLLIVLTSIFVKIILGRYVESVGRKYNSNALIGSGKDAISDAVISTSVFFSAILYIFTKINIEPYLGIVISIIIAKAGFELCRDTLDEILGQRTNSELNKNIKKTICSYDGVYGAYDLILHSYGVEKLIGSVNIEVQDTMDIKELNSLQRKISMKIYEEYGVNIASVGIYTINTRDEYIVKMKENIEKIVFSHGNIIQIHGFYADKEEKLIRFDMVIDYDLKKREELSKHILKDIQDMYDGYKVYIQDDIDI